MLRPSGAFPLRWLPAIANEVFSHCWFMSFMAFMLGGLSDASIGVARVSRVRECPFISDFRSWVESVLLTKQDSFQPGK